MMKKTRKNDDSRAQGRGRAARGDLADDGPVHVGDLGALAGRRAFLDDQTDANPRRAFG